MSIASVETDPKRRQSSLSLFRASTQPALSDVTLAHIINGETCAPISFSDFASFVANKEFTTENLLFVIWFRSYRARYAGVSPELRQGVPVPSTQLGDRYTPFAYLDEQQTFSPESSSPITPVTPRTEDPIVFRLPFSQPEGDNNKEDALSEKERHSFQVCEWSVDGRKCECGDARHRHTPKASRRGMFSFMRNSESAPATPSSILQHRSSRPARPPANTVFTPPTEQPMREEAERAFATFLRKSGSRELGISDELRKFSGLCLQRSTAPEVFLPVYEEIYQAMESQSLPHFLSYVKANVNKPKQMFWYCVGFIDILISVIIFTILTLLLSPKHFGYRAIRLPSIIFFWFGCAQMYSAYRGFCSQVWGRFSTQVKPWELDELVEDEESRSEGNIEPLSQRSASSTFQNPTPSSLAAETAQSPTQAGRLVRAESSGTDIIHTPASYRGSDTHVSFIDTPIRVPELSGTVTTPSGTHPWENFSFNLGSPLPVEEFVNVEAELLEEDEMSEAARRQLAIRRDTIKVPDAALAFPIDESPYFPPEPNAISRFPGQHSDSRKRSEISPFEENHSTSQSAQPPRPSTPPRVNTVTPAQTPSRDHEDLVSLLRKFKGKNREDVEGKRKVKMFGPERAVQDPRVKALFDSITRDILIVASILSVGWVALCLAVPTRGLA